MNKQEEKRFDEFCKKNGYEQYHGDVIVDEMLEVQKSNLKNWITQHDKRERERLIEEIFGNLERYIKIEKGSCINLSEVFEDHYVIPCKIINKYKH